MPQFSVSNSNNRYTLWLEVIETSTDINKNTSTLSYKLWLKANTSYHFSDYPIGYGVAFNRQLVAYQSRGSSPSYSINSYGTINLVSGTHTITHNDDGSLNMPFAFSIDMESLDYTPGPIRKEASMTLTTIPRASTIGATDANIESVSMLAIAKKSQSFTHSIRFQFGSLSGYVASGGIVSTSEVKISEASVPFKLPTSFYAQIPNVKSKVCTLYCKTYLGNTQIGDTKTTTFTATASESLCKPNVTGTVVDINDATKALTGNANTLIRYASTALCTISATPKNNASISAKYITGVAVKENTKTISEVTTSSFAFSATDSRGYSSSATISKTLIPYIKLTNNATATRNGSVSGDAKLYLSGDYYKGSFGATNNTLTAKYRIAGRDWVVVSPNITSNTYALQIELSGLNYQTAYNIEVSVSDKLYTVNRSIILSAADPGFFWGKDTFSFNVPVRALSGISCTSSMNRYTPGDNTQHTEQAFETWLTNRLQHIPRFSMLPVVWAVHPIISGNMFAGFLFKTHDTYAQLISFSYFNQLAMKTLTNGVWQPTKVIRLDKL